MCSADSLYNTYTAILEGAEDIAAEQGSSGPQVVMRNYLSDSRSRRIRREFMREQLDAAFGERTSQTYIVR